MKWKFINSFMLHKHRNINRTYIATVTYLWNIHQIKSILFMRPKVRITLPRWALQTVQWMTSSVLRPSIQVRIHEHIEHLLNLCRGNWVRHQENTVHLLWLCVRIKHQCYKHRVCLSLCSCSPVLCWTWLPLVWPAICKFPFLVTSH